MNFNRLKILLAILAIAGTTLAAQALIKSPKPLHGYAIFGKTGADQGPKFSFVSWKTDAAKSNRSDAVAPIIKAHLIVVGADIYLDANGNGQPESSERFQNSRKPIEAKSPDGQSLYRLTGAFLGVSPNNVSASMPQHVMLSVDIADVAAPESVKFRQTGKITMYPEPVDHGWAHFDGPLAIEFLDENLKLPAEGGPTVELRLAVVTPAVDCGTDAAQKKLYSNPTATSPGDLVPTATINFPSAYDKPITQRYDLDQFC